MRSDTGKMIPSEFMFSVACFILSSSLLTAFFMPITKHDSWLVACAGFMISLLFLWTYVRLMRRFPDKNVIQINDEVLGPIAGKLVSLFYIFFFLTLSALNLRDMGNFVQLTIMPQTPKIVLLIVFIIVCAWAVRNGIAVVARYSFFFTVVALIILVITTVLTFNLMRAEHFLPMLQLPLTEYVRGTNIVMTIPFGELVVFLMVTPNLNMAPQKIGKYFLGGFIIGGLSLLVIIVRDIAVLGNTITLFSLPAFETMRMAKLTAGLGRLEVLFAIVLIFLFFFKVSFLYYVTVLSISQLLKLSSYKSLVLGLGAVIIIYSLTIYPSSMRHAKAGTSTEPILWLFFELLLPLVTLGCAAVRKLPRKEEAA